MKQQTFPKKAHECPFQTNLPRALHTTIHNVKSKMDQAYLDTVKSTNSNKKWVDIDIKR